MLAQMQTWHGGGMVVGMHWLWWFFWIFVLCIIGWGVRRRSVDRSDAHKDVPRQEAAEDTLRRRFAVGDIGDEEYARRMKLLRET